MNRAWHESRQRPRKGGGIRPERLGPPLEGVGWGRGADTDPSHGQSHQKPAQLNKVPMCQAPGKGGSGPKGNWSKRDSALRSVPLYLLPPLTPTNLTRYKRAGYATLSYSLFKGNPVASTQQHKETTHEINYLGICYRVEREMLPADRSRLWGLGMQPIHITPFLLRTRPTHLHFSLEL